jgi:hypothetical protein
MVFDRSRRNAEKGVADQLGGRQHDCRPADVTEIKD